MTAMFEGKTVISSMMNGSTSWYESADLVLMALITLPSSALGKIVSAHDVAINKSKFTNPYTDGTLFHYSIVMDVW